jgi:hypothetical protein
MREVPGSVRSLKSTAHEALNLLEAKLAKPDGDGDTTKPRGSYSESRACDF